MDSSNDEAWRQMIASEVSVKHYSIREKSLKNSSK